jgi:hypothetical protein
MNSAVEFKSKQIRSGPAIKLIFSKQKKELAMEKFDSDSLASFIKPLAIKRLQNKTSKNSRTKLKLRINQMSSRLSSEPEAAHKANQKLILKQ